MEMERSEHARTPRRLPLDPPRFRKFVLIVGTAFALTLALLATNLRDTPVALAAHSPTEYNLCDRSLHARGIIIRELRDWGRTNSDTRYDLEQRFGCGPHDHDRDNQTPPVALSAIISAADLRDHTDWTTYNGRLLIRTSAARELQAGDFAGLNATIFDFNGTSLRTLPGRLFEGLTIQQLTFWNNQDLESLPEDLFEGIVGTGPGMGFTFELNPKITSESLPPTIFDPLGNSAEAPSNNLRDKGGIQAITFRRNGVSQLNTRWFAHFRQLGATYDWGSINLSDPTAQDRTEFWDSYYYDDGTGKYTDPTKTTRGVNSITSSTTKANIAAAIKAAIDSVGDASDVKPDFTTGNTLQVTTGNFGSVDLCERTTAVRDEIIKELRAEQSSIYGSVSSGGTITDGTYGAFGCSTGRTAIVTKVNLTAHTNWDTDAGGMNLDNKNLTALRAHDLRYLDLEYLTFGRNSISELPDDIFSGLPLRTLRMNRIGITKLQSGLFRGVNASNFQILGLADNADLSDLSIAPDVFDPLTELRFLDINDSAIGRINTRWFKELTKLGEGAGWHGLVLSGLPVVSYFSSETGGYYETGATNKVAYNPTSTTDQAALRTAIIAAIDTPQPDLNIAGSKFRPPDALGIDPCGRSEVVWKELMRQFGHIPNEIAGGWRNFAPMETIFPVSDIRYERYADITLAQCRVLPAQWVNAQTGLVTSQGAPNFGAAVLSIKPVPWHAGQARMASSERAFNLSGADLSRLSPNDLANLHAFEVVHMQDANLEAPNVSLFSHMPNITELNLAGNSIRTSDFNATPNFLSPLRKLENLNLNDNLFTTFNGDWIPASARSTLEVLRLEGNPMTRTDLENLNLRVLSISRSSITQLDSAINDMTNLRELYWSDLRALPIDGIDEFIQNLPDAITRSEPGDRIGNPGDLDDSDLDAAITNLQMAYLTRLRDIDVEPLHFADACRPPIHEVKPVLATTHQWAWEQNFGNLCLTDAQRNTFINDLYEYGPVEEFDLVNLNLNDTQMADLLSKIKLQIRGRNLWGTAVYQKFSTLRLVGNPNAFGDGFNDAALDVFDDQHSVTELTISHSDLNFTQANNILRDLELAFSTRSWALGLITLDLSFNNRLFTDVDPDTARPLLRGIMQVPRNATPVDINLRSTNLSFDQLKAMLDGMDGAPLWNRSGDGAVGDLRRIRTLDISDNANLWKRKNQNDEWVNVPATEINELLTRLPGLTTLRVGGTSIESQTMLQTVFNGLDHAPSTYRYADQRDTSTLERLQELDLSGNNLMALTAAELETEFAKMGTRIALQSPQLRTLSLGYTQIDLAQLTAIVNGLDTADLLDGIFTLDLSGNINLVRNCPTGGLSDDLSAVLAKFTNLRHIDISDTGTFFQHMACIVNGLNAGDGNAQDGLARNLISLNLRDNPQAFFVEGSGGDIGGPADKDDVAQVFAPLRNARTNLVNTEITAAQANAILQSRTMGLSEDERRETERRFTAQNPAFGFKTPLPTETRLLSGRGSLRVAFVHNPMRDGAAFEVLRYEYRYRVRPENADTEWGNTGTEAWRDAEVDLSTTGDKNFDIHGLATQTVYQVQVRATSVAQPNVLMLTGGTTVKLPKVNSIRPAITEVNIRTGDQIRLEVDILGLSDNLDNALPTKEGINLIFTWSDSPAGGSFATPNDSRRVTYTASNLPGTYTITAEAGPDGICRNHHDSTFGISEADRAPCTATFTVRVSRAPAIAVPDTEPINPAGTIPTSLADADGTAYEVFTPVAGGTFNGEGITVTAAKGAVPDRQLIGVRAAVSATQAPAPVPGARMTIAGSLYDITAIQANRQPVSAYKLDEPLSACLPLPEAFRANLTNIVLVERKADGSYGILTSKLRQTAGELNVCGGVSTLPATVGVAKLGVVPALPPTPAPEIETPDTGATAPGVIALAIMLLAGTLLLAGISKMRRIRG